MKVKICCISSIEEALLAIECGATELGLVGPMPSGPGVISEALISEIVHTVPNHINTFLLTSETSTDRIVEQHNRVKTSTIQIVDELTKGSYQDLRDALPSTELVQVIHVLDEGSLEMARKIEPFVDYILLDSGNPNKAIKELGGTGRTHDWQLSKQIVETVNIPVFLAGGLNSTNIGAAISAVRPYGVDLCSGVRSNNQLDKEKLIPFFNNIPINV